MPTTPIDTAKSTDRRPLKFASIALVQRDLDALEAANRAGTLRATGNWTPGQICAHLAAFINYAYDGYPAGFGNPPWFIKAILKFQKNKYLNKGLPAGVKIPGIKDGTVGADQMSFEDGLARLRAALKRLDAAPPTTPNVIFGPLTHDEWRNLHQRHCELHLSFLHPK